MLGGWLENELFDALGEPRRKSLRDATIRRLAQVPLPELGWRRPLVSVAETDQ